MDSTHEFKLKNFKPTADIIKRYYNGREVVLFGDSPLLRELLERDYGIKTTLVATGVKEKIGKDGFIDLDSLKNRSSEYYIAIPFLKSEVNLKTKLVTMGYLEFKDFVFTMHDLIVVKPGSDDYNDEYGNHVHCSNCKVIIEPKVGNTIINVDDSTIFKNNCYINVRGSGANIKIGKGCVFERDNSILANSYANLTIGNNTTFNYNNVITIPCGNSIHIGNDCMFSYEIELYTGDGHAVFDVSSGNRTNAPSFDETPKNTIIIKDHVWIGLRAIIMGNTIIERSSIVGAGAVVKGKFPNNCAIAGNPAKAIKQNVTWTKDLLEDNIEKCGKENIGFTEEI